MQSSGTPNAKLRIDGTESGKIDSNLSQERNVRNLQLEIALWKDAGWSKFYNNIDVLKTSNSEGRAQLFDSIMLKTVTYGYKTSSPTKAVENTLAVTAKSMQRMLFLWPYW